MRFMENIVLHSRPSQRQIRSSQLLTINLYLIGGTESIISFSTNTYTVAEFISDFQTKLNAVSNVFTASQHGMNNKLIISRTGSDVVTFNAQSSSSYIIGLYFDTGIFGGSQCTFDGPLNLALPNAYRIRINDISIVEDKNSYSSFYIPIDVNVFDVVNYKSKDYFEQKITFSKPTRNLDVTLCNADGQVYTSSDWEIVIKKCECS